MQNLQEYLQVFKNIVEKETINEVSKSAFRLKAKGNILSPDQKANITSIVNKNESNFEKMENKPFNEIVSYFKELGKDNLVANFNKFFNEVAIILQKMISDKQTNKKSANIDFEKMQAFHDIIKNKKFKVSDIEKIIKDNDLSLSRENAKLRIKDILEKMMNDLNMQNTESILKPLFKTLEDNNVFTNLRAELSFVVTLYFKLKTIDYKDYIDNMFTPNAKIKLTEKRLNEEQNDKIKNYVNYINREDNSFDLNSYKYPTQSKVLQFTLPAFKSKFGTKVCNGAGACAAFCYAAAGTYTYPDPVFKAEFSLIFSLSKEFLSETIKHLKAKLSNPNIFYFIRIHDSGDFYSRSYLYKWFKIARAFPNAFFYGYTKQVEFLNLKSMPPNFKFIHSFKGRNDELLEKLLKIKSEYYTGEKNELTPEYKKEIIRILDIKEEDFSEENLKQIMRRLSFSMVFKDEEEFEKEKRKYPGIKWILVVDDDVAALDVALDSKSEIGVALIIHGQNKGKLK